MPVRPLTILLLAAALPSVESITVIADRPAADPPPPAGDPALHLRLLPGVDGVRMGGIGIDPVVRGQSASRLQVEVDGACPVGGCPNRMDPPSSYAAAGSQAEVAEAGGLSVRHPGAPAAVIAIETPAPAFTADRPATAEARARIDGNGHGRTAIAALALGDAALWAGARGELSRADDYEDGDGQRVRSAYRSAKGGVSAGWSPADGAGLTVAHDRTRERDVLYAGANMDAPSSDGAVSTLRWRQRRMAGALADLSADLWLSQVEHLMDNYSLRPATGMLMRAPSQSDAAGGRLSATLRLPLGLLAIGVDGDERRQDARRYSGVSPAAVTSLNSLLWPDVRQRRLGAWSDVSLPVGDAWRVVPGVRLDVVDSRAADADVDPPGGPLSPQALYAAYYGSTAEDRQEVLAGAAVRAEHGDDGRTVIVALSRQQRAADATERFIAGNGATPAQRWIGDPQLAAETHWQAQVQARRGAADGDHARVEGWIDRVEDFIRRDRARGQDGVLRADGATIYRPAEALLAGAVAAAAYDLRSWLGVSADAAWTWGEDLGTGLPLAQIPPLAGSAAVRLGERRLHAVAGVRWSARATRIDDDPATGSGLDAGSTPAWLVVDLRLAWEPASGIAVSLGCDNLFDRTYAEHLNKPSAFDPQVEQVNEPGRNLWLAATARF